MEEPKSGMEVRKLYILYFLCRKGRIEDPQGHLIIRVHRLSRNGICLRDIKRWLAELRGNDMPDSFAWSYKRKHIKGFVWQDLKDDDLITPDPNNEYVLKGSEIPPLTSTQGTQRKSTSEIEEVLPESTLPVDFVKEGGDKSSSTTEQDKYKDVNKSKRSHLISYLINVFNIKDKKMNPSATIMGNAKPSTASDTSFSPNTKSHRNVKMLRNFITCRTIETNDSLTVPSVDRSKKSPKSYSSEAGCHIRNEARREMQRKGMKAIWKCSYTATLPANNAMAKFIYEQTIYAYLLTH